MMTMGEGVQLPPLFLPIVPYRTYCLMTVEMRAETGGGEPVRSDSVSLPMHGDGLLQCRAGETMLRMMMAWVWRVRNGGG